MIPVIIWFLLIAIRLLVFPFLIPSILSFGVIAILVIIGILLLRAVIIRFFQIEG